MQNTKSCKYCKIQNLDGNGKNSYVFLLQLIKSKLGKTLQTST